MSLTVNDVRSLAVEQVKSTDAYLNLKSHMTKHARQGHFKTQVDINDAPSGVREVLKLEGFNLQYTQGMLGVIISWE